MEISSRLGVDGGYASLKKHSFFKDINWSALAAGLLPPPIVPPKGVINADLPEKLKDEFKVRQP